MFGRLYVGEIKKLLRPKSLIILSVVLIVFFIIIVVALNFDMNAMFEAAEIEGEGIDLGSVLNRGVFSEVDASNIDGHLAFAKATLENDDTYYNRSVVTALEYMKIHRVYGDDFVTAVSFGKNAEIFVTLFGSILMAIVAIFGIVLAAGIYTDEYKNGTIKLVMLRPITKNQLTTAKFLAGLTVLVTIMGLTSLVAYLYGLAAYGTLSLKTIYLIFNSTSVIKSTFGGAVFLSLLSGAMQAISYYILSFAVSTLLKKKTAGILLSMLIFMGIVSMILNMISGYLPPFLFSANTSVAEFFTFGSGNGYMINNFFMFLPMFFVYNGGLLAATYLIVNKRDIY